MSVATRVRRGLRLGAAAAIGLGLLSGCSRSNVIPGYAEVWASDSARAYVSPPCLQAHPEWRPQFVRKTTLFEMHMTWTTADTTDRFRPYEACAREGGFADATRRWPLPLPVPRVDSTGHWRR